MLRGVLRLAMDGKQKDRHRQVERAVLALWRSGMAMSRQKKRKDPTGVSDSMLDGLLIARALASGEPEDEE